MRKFHIKTFGCQMNDQESAILRNSLTSHGHAEAASEAEADLVLFNTCAVRAKAEQKAFSEIGRYRQLKIERPELLLGVGGCMAQSEGRAVFSRGPHVDFVFGTKTMHLVPDMVKRASADRARQISTALDHDAGAVEEFYHHATGEGLKAFVTVMQGCDNFCAYCIVPHVRGREVSRPAKDVVGEVERLTTLGVREVTLLGQNVNSYGQKGGDGADFAELVRRVAAVPDILRIRFTTSHPKDLGDGLIALFASEPKLMPHLHLPLQSGSDRILSAMNRGYTSAHYLNLVEKLRALNPQIALTTDIIVGFPGETEEDFAETLALLEKAEFDNLFSFKYSPRSKTAAAKLRTQVAESEKEARLARLHEAQKPHTLAKNRQWLGAIRPVLVEGGSKTGGTQLTGRTPENKVINFDGPETLKGTIAQIEVTEAYANSFMGRLRDAPEPEFKVVG